MERIVVGVDGSPESQRALRWAAQEAELHDVDLVVVHAYPTPVTYGGWVLEEGALTEARRQAEAEADRVVDEALKGTPTGLRVTRALVADAQPARALLDHVDAGCHLVVGSRGRGGFSGLILGSVSQQVLHHASCPVTVIRSG